MGNRTSEIVAGSQIESQHSAMRTILKSNAFVLVCYTTDPDGTPVITLETAGASGDRLIAMLEEVECEIRNAASDAQRMIAERRKAAMQS